MRVAQNPDAAWRVLEGHAFVVPHGGTGVVELDEVGTFIWGLIEAERSLDDLVRSVCDEFEVDSERARTDCATFLEDLVRRGLVAVRPDAP